MYGQQTASRATEVALKKELSYAWDIKTLASANGAMRIVVDAPHRISESQYLFMMERVCFVLLERKATSQYKAITIVNPAGNGFILQDGSTCETAMKSKDSKPVILGKTKAL